MRRKRFFQASAGVALVAVVGAGVALAAAPLPIVGKVYDTGAARKSVGITFIVSATNPKRLIAGPASPPLGSQFSLSTGSVQCPKAKRNPGLPSAQTPFALFGFPGAKLKLSHGKYGFSASRTIGKESILGSSAKPFKLQLKFTGTVTSANKIAGTIKVHGGPCTRDKPIPYTAKLDHKAQAAPGA